MRNLLPDPIQALWLLWLAGWVVGGWRTKRVVRTESAASRLSHVIPLGLGAVLLMFRRAAGPLLAMRMFPYATWTYWVAAALVFVGLLVAAWARIHLAGNWSGTVTLKQDHSLTRTGPYRFVRHPIYTGLLIAILGSAIATGEWRGLVAFALITLSFLRKIAIEERFLTTQFGDAYVRYRAEVPALVPWRMGRF
jgi:protein-S-isoprenylcysteine O-methyltransferase Ste14